MFDTFGCNFCHWDNFSLPSQFQFQQNRIFFKMLTLFKMFLPTGEEEKWWSEEGFHAEVCFELLCAPMLQIFQVLRHICSFGSNYPPNFAAIPELLPPPINQTPKRSICSSASIRTQHHPSSLQSKIRWLSDRADGWHLNPDYTSDTSSYHAGRAVWEVLRSAWKQTTGMNSPAPQCMRAGLCNYTSCRNSCQRKTMPFKKCWLKKRYFIFHMKCNCYNLADAKLI